MKWLLLTLLLVGCASDALKYARLKHPDDCVVRQIGTEGWYDIIEVRCPHSPPKIEKYRER